VLGEEESSSGSNGSDGRQRSEESSQRHNVSRSLEHLTSSGKNKSSSKANNKTALLVLQRGEAAGAAGVAGAAEGGPTLPC